MRAQAPPETARPGEGFAASRGAEVWAPAPVPVPVPAAPPCGPGVGFGELLPGFGGDPDWGPYIAPPEMIKAAHGELGSWERDYGNIFDRQTPVPRPAGVAPARALTTLGPGVGPRSGYGPLWGYADFAPPTGAGETRGDAVYNTAHLTKPLAFVPSAIPVPGQPTFGLPGPATVSTATSVGTHVFLEEHVTTRVTTIRLFTEFAGFARADGTSSGRFSQVYGQVGGVVGGEADTFFSDPAAFPNTLDLAGPNALTNLKHALIGYKYGVEVWDRTGLTVGLSLEEPKPLVVPPDPKNAAQFTARSRIPDICTQARLASKAWGHVQVASIVRGVGIENVPYTTGTGATEVMHPAAFADVLGWGVQGTGVVFPFTDCDWANDRIGFGGVYGRGISGYNVDLQPLNTPDGVFDARDELRALPLATFFLSYTHVWAPGLHSTAVYSQVDLRSIDSPDLTGSPYRRGRYMAANLIYEWEVPNPADATKPPGRAFAGIEYLYGRKELLDGKSGDARRVQVTAGAKY